ncbi:hypothetical protein OBBRIDRAFT_249413 [Obba rivulosa]|uniref:Uncharacterized protein n=1 Tax=Obba rivulosa TaxID=1052685 RepID=A0A8E2AT68_9APHY|nr:hypothetical protein OBBRIDRAFT_249413 [Obba rivulosa]
MRLKPCSVPLFAVRKYTDVWQRIVGRDTSGLGFGVAMWRGFFKSGDAESWIVWHGTCVSGFVVASLNFTATVRRVGGFPREARCPSMPMNLQTHIQRRARRSLESSILLSLKIQDNFRFSASISSLQAATPLQHRECQSGIISQGSYAINVHFLHVDPPRTAGLLPCLPVACLWSLLPDVADSSACQPSRPALLGR